MTKKTSPLVTGIVAGLAAGLLLPQVAKKFKSWAETPEGKKALKEVLPSEAEQEKMLSLWKNPGEVVTNATQTLKKHWNDLVGQAEETVVAESEEAAQTATKTVASVAKKAQKSVSRTAKKASKAIDTAEKKATATVRKAKTATKKTAKTVAKKTKAE